jgi:hypothetical protein
MGPRGMSLNRWTLNFNPKFDVSSAVLVWVRLFYLPLHCWCDDYLLAIGNALGNTSINLSSSQECLYGLECVWKWIWKNDSSRLSLCLWTTRHICKKWINPFKCKACQEYNNFAKDCKVISLLNPFWKKKNNDNTHKRIIVSKHIISSSFNIPKGPVAPSLNTFVVLSQPDQESIASSLIKC